MKRDTSYAALNARKNEIMQAALGINYEDFELPGIGFDYERMMRETGYTIDEMRAIQLDHKVGDTPLIELHNLTKLARSLAPAGKGARIFLKDEACNISGSFKARRASISLYEAARKGYRGVMCATSGNYGAAVAAQAALYGLNCIVVQECYDSRKVGQPEILEKQRICEAYGAEVVQLTVGPELFTTFLKLLEETGYFNASLYTPFGIAGIETLGWELVSQCRTKTGRDPDMVICTNAGGGNVTGTARGVRAAGCQAAIVGASIDLHGLHMASDHDFNRKSFTTGHTGFGMPFMTWPDRSDCPRNAARMLRHMDRFVTVKQGETFYITEALASLEGYERGPAGNTSLTAAFALSQQMDQEQIIIVQETEYTGAGKHPMAQLSFARDNGVEILFGDPDDDVPGKNIILPSHPRLIKAREYDLDECRRSYIKNCVKNYAMKSASAADVDYLCAETRASRAFVEAELAAHGVPAER